MSYKYVGNTRSLGIDRKVIVDEQNVTVEVLKMLNMLKLNEHFEVVGSVFEGIGGNFKIYTSKLWTVIVPKNPSSEFLPMLCAHTDTIQDTHPTLFAYTDITQSKICNFEQKLCGADDRLGCFIISELIKSNPNDFIFALFDKEEVGGIGSSDFTKSPEFAEVVAKTSCFLGLDRRGDSDLASYDYESQEFLDVLTEIEGYEPAFGTFTDVATLAEEALLSCVNFSVGYYSEHTSSENFSPTECLHTLEVMKKLPKKLWEKQYTCIEKQYYPRGFTGNSLWKQGYGDYSLYDDGMEFCDCCGTQVKREDTTIEEGTLDILCTACTTTWSVKKHSCELCGNTQKVSLDNSGLYLCDGCNYTYSLTPPKTGSYKVDLYKFLDCIDFIVSEISWASSGARKMLPPKDIRQAMKDINYISSVSRYDELRDDQIGKVSEICDRYEYSL